jgi:DNA-binding SARP family transcriptional activator
VAEGDWLEPVRERYRQMALEAHARLGALGELVGDLHGARQAWAALLELEPAREDAHRALMRILHGLGRREEALAQFRQCVAVLRAELDVAPSPQTLSLHHEILATGV